MDGPYPNFRWAHSVPLIMTSSLMPLAQRRDIECSSSCRKAYSRSRHVVAVAERRILGVFILYWSSIASETKSATMNNWAVLSLVERLLPECAHLWKKKLLEISWDLLVKFLLQHLKKRTQSALRFTTCIMKPQNLKEKFFVRSSFITQVQSLKLNTQKE